MMYNTVTVGNEAYEQVPGHTLLLTSSRSASSSYRLSTMRKSEQRPVD